AERTRRRIPATPSPTPAFAFRTSLRRRRRRRAAGKLVRGGTGRNPGAAPAGTLDSRPMSQADLTHQRLVRAALELFTTQGYHGSATTPCATTRAARPLGTAGWDWRA